MIENNYTFYKKIRIRIQNAFPFIGRRKGALSSLKIRHFTKRLAERKRVLDDHAAGHDTPLLFNVVEVETVNRCNGECQFCPVNKNRDPRTTRRMDDALFEKIIAELAAIEYSGLIHLYSNNEPFLDRRIPDFARTARAKLPKARIGLSTNGLIMTRDQYRATIDSLDFLTVNNYCDDYQLLDSHKQIEEWTRERDDWFQKTKITIRNKKEFLTTRGGGAPNRDGGINRTLSCGCHLPSHQLIIRPDGKLSICCNDATGQTTVGDVSQKGLVESWNNPEYTALRYRILEDRNILPPCRECDTLAGRL
ncbi:MAG: SPASM domain-containing protein [Planctomycetaceae bacterium]|nr:SPASM domain-containing protein [Planctomycetaceae bacterium]